MAKCNQLTSLPLKGLIGREELCSTALQTDPGQQRKTEPRNNTTSASLRMKISSSVEHPSKLLYPLTDPEGLARGHGSPYKQGGSKGAGGHPLVKSLAPVAPNGPKYVIMTQAYC